VERRLGLPSVAHPIRTRGREAKTTVPPRKNPNHNFASVYKPPRCALESRKGSEAKPYPIPFRIPIDHVFNAIRPTLGQAPKQIASTESEGI